MPNVEFSPQNWFQKDINREKEWLIEWIEGKTNFVENFQRDGKVTAFYVQNFE